MDEWMDRVDEMKVMERGEWYRCCCWITVSDDVDGDTLYPVLGLTESWTVYDKSPGMDFYILHNSKGYRMGRLAGLTI